jgi:glycosyltransferase involved in cell wall biosynthesis
MENDKLQNEKIPNLVRFWSDEAMAAKSPVVVSDTGGLSEIVEHDISGVKAYPNNPDSLAWAITKVITDDGYANWLKTNAYKKIQEKYNWNKIAQQTKTIYNNVLSDYSKSFWAKTSSPQP